MEEAPTAGVINSESASSRIRLGMSSFGIQKRNEHGQKIRLAMACIEGKEQPNRACAMPSDTAAINKRLVALSQDITSHHADLLELLVRFDELEGWKVAGAKHCMAWMNYELGINMKLGYEYLRVGRELRSLPTTMALFRAGKLSWSKVRLISRVAENKNEKILCHAALDASVTDVERLCTEYRWKEENSGCTDSDNDRYLQQWESRSLSHTRISDGSTLIRLRLPPELAQAYLNSIEHSLNQVEESESTISQRRADAAVLMAESSLQSAGRDIATADRYQVIVSVDAACLGKSTTPESSTRLEINQSNNVDNNAKNKVENKEVENENEKNNTQSKQQIPTKRPTIRSAGPIARETARRIACDCSITGNIVLNGEPVDIGRGSRLWPTAMSRAIKNRDKHCQWPGCTQSYNLKIHHIKHWADGGTTCVENGCCLCQSHHTAVHEGGFTIQRVDQNAQRIEEQFIQQRHDRDITQFDFERQIRADRNSFDTVRQLSPTRYRFRVVDSLGRDIRDHGTSAPETTDGKISKPTHRDVSQPPARRTHSTLVVPSTQENHASNTPHTPHTPHTPETNQAKKQCYPQLTPEFSTCVDSTQCTGDAKLANGNSSAITRE